MLSVFACHLGGSTNSHGQDPGSRLPRFTDGPFRISAARFCHHKLHFRASQFKFFSNIDIDAFSIATCSLFGRKRTARCRLQLIR